MQKDPAGDELSPVERLFDCLLGLSKLERQLFMRLLDRPGECCQDLARRERKDRTVIQKAMKRLLDKGLIERQPVRTSGPERNTYKYVYAPIPIPELRARLLALIDETRLRMLDVVNRVFI